MTERDQPTSNEEPVPQHQQHEQYDPPRTDPFGLRAQPEGYTGSEGYAGEVPARERSPQQRGGSPWAMQQQSQQPYAPQTPAYPQHHTTPYAAGPAPETTTAGPAPAQPAPNQVRTKRRSGRLVGAAAAFALVAAAIGGGVGGAVGYQLGNDATTGNASTALDAPKPPVNQTGASTVNGSVEQVAAKVLPSVVQIRVSNRSVSGEGSGVVLSADGLILTNNHVVDAAANGGQLTVVLSDGRQVDASIVGRDPSSDIAVIKAQGVGNLSPAELGRSDNLVVGQQVVAVGSPLGLSGTVTTGIVSALHRPVRSGGESSDQTTVLDAIQTDAAINPGNSGGPLVDGQGRVIGINSAIATLSQSQSGQGGSIGLGFAIPIDQARRIADELVKSGQATQAVLGVGITDAQDGGAEVTSVDPSGAAAGAGIKVGDVITKVDDRLIADGDELVAAVRSHAPGDKVTLTVGGKSVQVTLGSRTVSANG
jgi:putative serine protease PepD